MSTVPETAPGATSILLATGNPAKQDALRQLLAGLPLSPVAPAELGLASFDPAETGESHLSIAEDKAAAWSRQTDLMVIASDGGLVIPALGSDWESRYTHRFAGPAADDGERRRRLLEIMEPCSGRQRQASWIEALAIARHGQILHSWELAGGSGVIAQAPPAGPHPPGFWVFSLWYFPQYGKYYNQLTAGEKADLGDHWAVLRERVKEWVQEWQNTAA